MGSPFFADPVRVQRKKPEAGTPGAKKERPRLFTGAAFRIVVAEVRGYARTLPEARIQFAAPCTE